MKWNYYGRNALLKLFYFFQGVWLQGNSKKNNFYVEKLSGSQHQENKNKTAAAKVYWKDLAGMTRKVKWIQSSL